MADRNPEGSSGMKKQDSVRKFEYRPSRTAGGFDLEFIADGKTITGFCKDLSEEGIRATLDGPVVVGSFGLVVFRHSTGTLELEAQVAYIDKLHIGIVFLFQTAWERTAINNLIALIQDIPGESMVVPFS
jgi:hypothetical protein